MTKMYKRVVRNEKTIAKKLNELLASVFTAEGASCNVFFIADKLEESDRFKINTQEPLKQATHKSVSHCSCVALT